MTTAVQSSKSVGSDETLDDDFFNAPEDPTSRVDDPIEMAPCDPIVERKMSLAVQARRARFTRLVKAAVGCAALLWLVAVMTGLVPGLRKAFAAGTPPATTVGKAG